MLSVLDVPVSDAAVRSGADGAAGATVSTVTSKPADAPLTMPLLFFAVAVMVWTPFASVVEVIVHAPVVAFAVAVPIAVVPSYSVTVVPGVAVPVKLGRTVLVMLSVLEAPVSDAVARSGADGSTIADAMVTARALESPLTLPATSAALAVIVWPPAA